jgi:hypothetical protein
MLAMEIPVQWQSGASFLMNQRTAGLLLTMSDAVGRLLLESVQGVQDGPRWSLFGFPIYVVSQMLDVAAGSTAVAFRELAADLHGRCEEKPDELDRSLQRRFLRFVPGRGAGRRRDDLQQCGTLVEDPLMLTDEQKRACERSSNA